MKITKRTSLFLYLCGGICTLSFIIIALFSGFHYEYKKLKQFLLTLVCIFLIRYIFLEHIAFAIQAVIVALKGEEEVFIFQEPEPEDQENNECNGNPLEFLKLQLISLKCQLNLEQRHKDETQNLVYKQLTEEFWIFGKYFLLLLLVIIYSRNPYGYYNTATMRKIINESYFSNYKLEKVVTINDLYYWINDTLIAAFNEGLEYDEKVIEEPGWLHFHLAKLLGVVRLQQVRHVKKEQSMMNLYYDEQDYLPRWRKLNESLPYIDKYWRIYYPWLSKHYEGVSNWLMSFSYIGSLYSYRENKGYVALLARDRKSSEQVLHFLKRNNWLDSQTAAVFIDFTLYNADSNIFTICSILVEQTPFGNLVWQLNVQSAELLWNMNEISLWWWLLIILYTLQMIQLCKLMIVRSWFSTGFFNSPWNCVDFAIVLLNISLICFIVLREYYVLYVMKTFVLSNKLEYVDFRVASMFDYTATVILGFLICLASIRIWKVLQFSSIFRIFNRTLYTSAVPLFSTMLGIHIFLCAIGLTAQILNGAHAEIFSRYLKSITSIMSFTFGFNSRTNPDDLSHGGGILAFILYLILMFVVAIFLINMFITLICEHFSNAREERDQESPDKLTYWEFLTMEYSWLKEYFFEFKSYFSHENIETEYENISQKLDELHKKLRDEELLREGDIQYLTEDQLLDAEMQRANRLQNIVEILNIQMQLLDRQISVQALDWDSDNNDSDY